MEKLLSVLTILALAFLVPALPVATAATYTVSNNNDSGAGSLRQAVTDANAVAGSHTIDFTSAVSGTITLLSALTTTKAITFDLSGASGIVTIEGSTIGSSLGRTLNGGTLSLGIGSGMPGEGQTFTLANTGTATLNLTNGSTITDSTGTIGNAAGSNGTVTVSGSGSSWTNSGDLNVGYSGTGTLNVFNGAVVTNSSARLGRTAGSNGTGTVDGSGSVWTNTVLFVAFGAGVGTLNIQNGGVVNSDEGYLGWNAAGANGIATVDGAGSKWTNTRDFVVGSYRTGTFSVQNGGVMITARGRIGSTATAVGAATVDGAGSSWSNSEYLYVGNAGAGTLTVKNNGVINVSSGLGTITIAKAVGSTGTLNIGAGGTAGILEAATVTGGLGTATLNFNHNEAAYTFSPALTGSLVVNHNGSGKTTFGDTSYTGATTINAGMLAFTKSCSIGDITMNGANRTLDIGLNTIMLGGAGIYTQGNATSQLNVGIGGSQNGQINASAGGAAVSAGILNLNVSSYVPNNTPYTIVLGQAGSTGTIFSSLIDNSAVLSFLDSSTATDVIVTANRTSTYNSLAADGNTSAVGSVLEQAGASGVTGDMAVVLGSLDSMSSGAGINNALDTMIPDASAGTVEGGRALTSQGFTTISNRLGGARNGGVESSGVSSGEMLNGVGVWMEGLGNNMKQGERKGIEGYQANTFGTMIGADKTVDDHLRLGFAGGYGFGKVKSKSPGSPSDTINSYQGIIYGSYDSVDLEKAREAGNRSYEAVRSRADRSWYMDGMLGVTENHYDSRREIWLGALKRVAKAKHYAQEYSTNAETGCAFIPKLTKALEITPFLSLGYNYLYMNKYKESGADSLNLTVQGEGFHQLEQGLGAKLAYPILTKKMGTFIPSVKVAWTYDYIADRFETTSSFAGGGSSFNTQGAKPAKSGMLFGAKIAFLNKGNITLIGNWDIELKDQFMSNTYYGTVRCDF